MPRAARTLLAACAIGALALPAGAAAYADGGRAATAAEARAMTAAVLTTPVAGINRVPRNRYRVTGHRVSTRARSWGVASIVPRPAFQGTLEGAAVLLVRTGGPGESGPWVAVDAGTSGVGCLVAPFSVLRNLRMADCPAGDRL